VHPLIKDLHSTQLVCLPMDTARQKEEERRSLGMTQMGAEE